MHLLSTMNVWAPHPSIPMRALGTKQLSIVAALIEAAIVFLSGLEPFIQVPREPAYIQVEACCAGLQW